MNNDHYEIEIKCLLGSRENAEKLEARMQSLDPNFRKTSSHTQLNHYFAGNGDFKKVVEVIADQEKRAAFLEMATQAKDFSLRTRDADGKVLLVLKASIDDTTSANGIARRESEMEVPMTLGELDKVLLDAGFLYQAKWSRARNEYAFGGANVTIDKNAGYGYLAEFEIIADDASEADAAKEKLHMLIARVDLKELDPARLERMFAFYNTHWPEYYGTEKIFVME